MTKEELAALINGREYRAELTHVEAVAAKAAGLLVIYGASDDLLEFDGAFRDEVGANNGTVALIHRNGVLPDWETMDKDDEEEEEVAQYFANKRETIPITAQWDHEGFSWVISANVPHATFIILEDGEDTYCRGIVIDMAEAFASGAVAQPPAVAAFQSLKASLQADSDYAWSWHCNLAMPVMDGARVSHQVANETAARLMRLIFDIDMTKHPHYIDLANRWPSSPGLDLTSDTPLTACAIPGNGETCESCQ